MDRTALALPIANLLSPPNLLQLHPSELPRTIPTQPKRGEFDPLLVSTSSLSHIIPLQSRLAKIFQPQEIVRMFPGKRSKSQNTHTSHGNQMLMML